MIGHHASWSWRVLGGLALLSLGAEAGAGLEAEVTAGPGSAPGSDLATGLARCAALIEPDPRLACFDALARGDAPLQEHSVGAGQPVPQPSNAARTEDREAPRELLGIRPYRANYLLPVTFDANPNEATPREESELPFLGDDIDKVEMKFQLSFEVPLWTDILDRPLDLYFAYTQLAFFQAYNTEYSSPFRDTNYEPELGLHWQPDLSLLGLRVERTRLALNHQSNGRSGELSRSWNRLVAEGEVERGPLSLAVRAWTLIGSDPTDNPDIGEYLGYGEIHAGLRLGRHRLGVMFRNPRHPTLQLEWSHPLGNAVSLYVQYFNGYGESLLDYDHSANRIGVGFRLNAWP